MRTRALLLASAASAAAILGGWQLGDAATTSLTVGSTTTTDTSGTGGTSSSQSSDAAAPAGSSASASGAADGTYTGTSVSTRFGNVQVQVTISGGAITDVTALHLTDSDGRSIQISNRAAPMLRSEVLQAQSASVSMIGGATYTSAAYLQSLQAALDQAGF
ncbi:FMN-binding protein [Agromyces bracchium]|uniref:FMN-binding protein n=1 Tax=Agromyces bracchium TaxID=88376 RepID=A0A6I3MAK8_9MICO|nr:FMN-binding protein [Agromyces bracchium]